MANKANNILKSLRPLINQRLQDLSSGVVSPGQAAPIGVSRILPYLATPGFGPSATPTEHNLTGFGGLNLSIKQADYSKLSTDDKALLDSVERMGGNLPEGHSLLGNIWHNI